MTKVMYTPFPNVTPCRLPAYGQFTPSPVFARHGAIAGSSCAIALEVRPREDRPPSPKESPVSATKILWGQLLIVAIIVLLGVWGATQWTAAALGYQAQLGPPWFIIGEYPLYPPPAFLWWWFSYAAYAPHIFIPGRDRKRVG